jgi:hypothetical protein
VTCNCTGRVDWEDDAPEMCDNCLDQQLAEVDKFEPPDDPQPRELMPDPEAQSIELRRANVKNVQRLLDNLVSVVHHVRDTPRDGHVHEIDLLTATSFFIRSLTSQMVLDRIPFDPTAALLNRTAITTMLQELLDEFNSIEIPTPVRTH